MPKLTPAQGSSPTRGGTNPLHGNFADLKGPYSEAQARAEARRCLECGGPHAPAPCTLGCPAGVDVPGFITAIADRDYDQAAEIIFSANLLGGSCARVCPIEETCARDCVLMHEGRRAVEIGRLQRYATDWALERRRALPRAPLNGRRVAVIGAGPSGLTCAGELAMRGYAVTIYDARREVGGLVRYAIAPYRQQCEPLPKETQRIADLGVHFKLNHLIATPEDLHQLEADHEAIFLGVGLGEDIDFSLPGDDLSGIWQSLPFIEALKTGNPPRVGAQVAVIGGGNTAIDVARESLRLGAEQVHLVYRRTLDEMPAYHEEVREACEEGVEFKWLTTPVRFLGRERLVAMECQTMRLARADASGRRRPEPVPGGKFSMKVDTVIMAIGQKRRTEWLSFIDGLELDGGLIKIDPRTGQTTNLRYFAGGDAVNGGATVVQAVQAAKTAACGIDEFLQGTSP
ncbi:MAG: FAD-dependent oxidoreductase [Bradymonadaceae bacterium]